MADAAHARINQVNGAGEECPAVIRRLIANKARRLYALTMMRVALVSTEQLR